MKQSPTLCATSSDFSGKLCIVPGVVQSNMANIVVRVALISGCSVMLWRDLMQPCRF
jgi:hypothetical protein